MSSKRCVGDFQGSILAEMSLKLSAWSSHQLMWD